VRIFTAIMVAAAVLATSVVSVRLHLHVVQLRYRVEGLEGQRVRAEREMRLAQAEFEAAKAPRRLMERWDLMHGSATPASARSAPTPATPAAPATPVAPVEPAADAPVESPPDDPLPAEPAPSERTPEDAR
jgi:hypothetical protein